MDYLFNYSKRSLIFCFLFTIFSRIYLYFKKKDTRIIILKLLLVSFLMGFINPYGIESIIYIFLSEVLMISNHSHDLEQLWNVNVD